MNLILVIDRDIETRLAARRALEAAGYTVSTAGERGGAAAPHLVLADIAAGGRAALRRRYPRARVLFLSHDENAEPRRPRPRDAAILRKPFTASELLAAVRRCLARSRA